LHPAWGLVLFFLAALATGSLARGAEPPGYDRRQIEGFTVYVSDEVQRLSADRWGRRPLGVLERELNDLRRILIPKVFTLLQEVPIWVEWDEVSKLAPRAVALYTHRESGDLLRKYGVAPQKAGCIQVISLRVLGDMRRPGTALQQVLLLHEMAHAVQDRLIGWDNPELLAAFEQAVERKLYDEVNDRFGRRTQAYARYSPAEYFAEISCAYLDSCNYYPFNYVQLQGHDPAGFAFVERVWKHPERFELIAAKPAIPGGWSRAAASNRVDVYAERAAIMALDKLRARIREGKTEDARKGLENLVRNYAGTAAAEDAQKLLDTLD
jgi:hypothetical protein